MTGWLDILEKEFGREIIEDARVEAAEGRDPVEFLMEGDLIPSKSIILAQSEYWKVPCIELGNYEPDVNVLNKVTEEVARRFGVLPLFEQEELLFLAVTNPVDLDAQDYIRQLTGYTIEPVVATGFDIDNAINMHYLSKEKAAQTMGDYADKQVNTQVRNVDDVHLEDKDAPAIKLINYIISQAVNLRASDVHLESFPGRIMLRYRIDGVLHEFPPPPHHLMRALVSRVKIISDLDIAERRLPQDGRSSFIVEGKKYDLRISIIPNLHGEGIVIRILDPSGKKKDLEDLGFSDVILDKYKEMVKKSYGIILTTGPTGSGKTTTLYATLKHIYTPKRKILTIEDPVEYQLDGITQIQVKSSIGFTFANGLRAILRHDPDVIMVGEIRDLETAEIAIRSSLTGHLVFSTLHTNDAPTAVTRLIDMGVAPYLVIASLNGVLAQRLVRRLCTECRARHHLTPLELSSLEVNKEPEGAKVYKPVGCPSCGNIGFRDRIAIYEFLEINNEMRRLDPRDVSTETIRKIAKRGEFHTLKESVYEKLWNGTTSLEEIINFTTTE